jgi:hypothetical protein
MGQTMMPTHILNAPLYQDALNVQAKLMHNAKSEMVRSNAAANLLMTLKPPEVAKVELSLNVGEDESIKLLRETTMKLVSQQQDMIDRGQVTVRSIAESKLIGEGDTSDKKVINV